jgi:hypothetical protein
LDEGDEERVIAIVDDNMESPIGKALGYVLADQPCEVERRRDERMRELLPSTKGLL